MFMNKKMRIIWIVSVFAVCFALSACTGQKQEEKKPEKYVEVENKKKEAGKPAQPLKEEKMQFGNTAARYCQEARVCDTDSGTFLLKRDGVLSRKYKGKEQQYNFRVSGGLNYYGEKLYYISAEDHFIYSVSPNEKDFAPGRVSEIEERVNTLIVCDAGFVYTDEQNSLQMSTWEGEHSVLNENVCLWVNYYGKWLIYSELNDSGSVIKACHIESKEELVLCDYGMYPTVYEGEMFYQGSGGAIEKYSFPDAKSETVTEEWGQKFLLLAGELYFTNNGSIKKINLSEHHKDTVYEAEKGHAIDRMWEAGDRIFFIETEGGGKEIWKVLDHLTGKASA